ncbi:MAG: hypothetical protein LBK26_03245 [Rickettsiales bacterium]|jgi:hypothetical protein|nr:hypothetical protein [Rickettsiales bacterium]
MNKFKKACFGYALTRARSAAHWILLTGPAQSAAGWLTIGSGGRKQLADWVLVDLFKQKMDFDAILHFLSGDEYYERNKKDVAKLERATGKSVMQLWDTDPIFIRFPRLKTLARNREFEKIWAARKQKMK